MTKMKYRGADYDTDAPKAEPSAKAKEVEENEELTYRGFHQDLDTAAQNAKGARETPGGHIYRGFKDDQDK